MSVLIATTANLAHAHLELGNYLQHRIVLTAAADHIDVTIEILFDGERSLRERRAMDTDRDATLSKQERDAYRKRVAEEATARVTMSVNGQPVNLVALYDPELDLLDSRGIERHPHQVRLSFFAQTKCAEHDVIAITDALWPNDPAIMLAEPGQDGSFEIGARQPGAPRAGASAGTARTVTFDVGAAIAAKQTAKPNADRTDRAVRSKGRQAAK